MLNIAVIGCGIIAQQHLRGIAKLKTARAVAVCDVRPEAAQKTAQDFEVPRWSTNASELFADPAIHAVILALPTNLRTPLALEAFKHGKHVLVEKPIAMNAAEARSLVEAQGDRVGACCSSRFRSFPSAKAAADYIRSGGLGTIRTITCRAVFKPADEAPTAPPPPWRLRRDLNGGGIFVNWGCYDLDYLLGMLDFQLTPQFALAKAWPVPDAFKAYAAEGSDAETHITALVTFAEGCVLTYERAEFSSLPPTTVWQICGDKGSVELKMLEPTQGNIVLTEPREGGGIQTRVLWEGEPGTRGREHDEVVRDFVEAVVNKRKPNTTLKEALLFARIADKLYESIDSGAPVSFAD